MEGHEVETDESALTGEPYAIKKDPESAPFLLSGTSVQRGQGRFFFSLVQQIYFNNGE